MNSLVENQLNNFLSEKIITSRIQLSQAFNMMCEKITLNTNEIYVIKYYQTKNKEFNSIVSETNSLTYLLKIFPKLFPSIKYSSKDLLIMDFIKNNNVKKENYQKILADEILKLHKIKNINYGFDFDSQIGALRQINRFESNWVNFFRDKRLNMIFEIINKTEPMPKSINIKIEKLINNLEIIYQKTPM